MSVTRGAVPPTAGLGLGPPWHRGAVLRSRALVQTELHGVPLEGSRTRPPLRLPALVGATRGPRRRKGMARLSFSEPSLLLPSESILLEGFPSCRRFTVLQKQPACASSSPHCKTCRPSRTQEHQPTQQPQGCNRPAHVHISQPVQPRTRRHSSSERMCADLHREEPLSVVGRSCLLGCSQRPAQARALARAQLHVFLPSEAEGEEADWESVDEGFMDELDTKISSMKLRQTAP
ncbi:uncharacterized protein LOC133460640 [Cololabis saira]|uniref:uncharacterized protein LOC133460640 n=1 Tax=Cololabis saira TaxID=129043 RepID=UPI002AD3E99D|nr:uncharacterized protein LOC133460640 [Cololabis saira]